MTDRAGLRVCTWVALVLAGCGGTTATPADGGTDAAITHDSGPDAPIAYCSFSCGPVEAGTDGAVACSPGEICGEDGTIVGFGCCVENDAGTCYVGYPGPGTVPCP